MTFPKDSFKVTLGTDGSVTVLQTNKTMHAAQISSLGRRVLRSNQDGHKALVSLKEESHLPVATQRDILVPTSLPARAARVQGDEAQPIQGLTSYSLSLALTPVARLVRAQQVPVIPDQFQKSVDVKSKLLRDHNSTWKDNPLDRMFAVKK